MNKKLYPAICIKDYNNQLGKLMFGKNDIIYYYLDPEFNSKIWPYHLYRHNNLNVKIDLIGPNLFKTHFQDLVEYRNELIDNILR